MKTKLILSLITLIITQNSKADISAKTTSSQLGVRLESSLQGNATEAFIDAAQLGLALSSMITGDSLIISGVLDGINGGIYSAPVNRVYGGWTAIQETAQLLQSTKDKSAHDETLIKISKDSRNPIVNLTFSASSDDDSFGHIQADTESIPGIRTEIRGEGTREGLALVNVDTRQLQPGIHSIVFFAKETDCNICLSIVHTVLVQVYDPCPPLGYSCQNAVQNYYQKSSEYIYHANQLNLIPTRGNAILHQIKGRENVCDHSAAGRNRNNLNLPEEQRRQAEITYSNCLDQVDAMLESRKGACTDIAYGLTENECAQYRNRKQILSPYLESLNQSIKNVTSLNCCQEQINPHGTGGPIRPPIVVAPPIRDRN
jgi:hypothetical protein